MGHRDHEKKFATSILARSTRLLRTAVQVAGKEASGRLQGSELLRLRVAQARAVTEQLRQLKGAVMKAGQFLSVDASDFLPPEAVEILGTLQGDAEPVSFEVIERVLREELGAEGFERLGRIESTPVAAASIGQVHRAHARGGPVAVKVQYPGVAKSIDSDLAMLERLARTWLSVTRRTIDVATIFEELSTILHLEADYVRERANVEEYRGIVASDDRFVVPRTFPALTTPRVLTMSFEEGRPVRAWLDTQPARADRLAFARALLDLYCREFFEYGFVQTDPNPANFLVRADGRVVLLDFGATIRYDATFRAQYVALLQAIAAHDEARVVERAVSFQLLDPRESGETRHLFFKLLENAVEPFAAAGQPFVFRGQDYLKRSREISGRFTRALQFSPPPRKLLFLHRKLGGLFNLLKRMDVRMDLGPYWDRMVAAPRPVAPPAAGERDAATPP